MPPSRKLRSRSGAVPTHRARPRHAPPCPDAAPSMRSRGWSECGQGEPRLRVSLLDYNGSAFGATRPPRLSLEMRGISRGHAGEFLG